MTKYALGLDFGTLSVRALLIDIQSGEEKASSVYEYPHGVMETRIPSGQKLPQNWALQDPQDYLNGLEETIHTIMTQNEIYPEEVIGIGIDFTSSTILPVKNDKTPLCQIKPFENNPHSYVKLWKHHGAENEALMMDEIIKERNEEWISLYGGKTSSEWMIPKIAETAIHEPELYKETDLFIEALDWITWHLTGNLNRSACGAGYKAFYHHERKYPSKEFFKAISRNMENVVEEKLQGEIKPVGDIAGYLTKEYAKKLGLKKGTPIAVGIIDAHASMVGAGITKPGEMMIIVGTSSCHMLLSEKEVGIPGVCGLVKDGIIPGYFAYEAGQCCVGDHFAWFTKNCIPSSYEQQARLKGMNIHDYLCYKLKNYKAGESGLIALDWWNGVRSPLMDFNLNGLILGMNLQTKTEEIYMALIEATAYGTRMIIESFEEAGVPIHSIVLGGGIPAKNKMLVQIYADITNREIKLCTSSQASAMGSAILGIAAADSEISGYKNIHEIASKLGTKDEKTYIPNKENVIIYDKLYQEYKTLHHYFGKGVNDVMKTLNALKK